MDGNETEGSASKAKRPLLVWVISIFYFISTALSIISKYFLYSGVIPLDEVYTAYYDSLTFYDHAITAIIMAANFIGAVLLISLRKGAYECFLISLAFNVLLGIDHILFKNWFSLYPDSGLGTPLVAWLISAAIILYTRKLSKNGILK